MKAVFDDDNKYNVKIVERCLAIFDFAAESETPFTVQDIMNALNVNANMAFRLLATMVASGYLNKDESTNMYTVSLKALKLFNRALSSLDIRKVALPHMEMLNQKFPNANINLGVLYDGEVIQTDRIDSATGTRTYFTPGKKLAFHASAIGKILISELYPEEVEHMVDKVGSLKDFTVNTITAYDKLVEELSKVRAQGYAIDRGELILHDNCNAAPIRNSSGQIVAAISMSAFDNYITQQEMDENIHFICDTARQISYFLGYVL